MTMDEARGFRFRDTTRAPFESIVRLRYDRQEGADYARTSDLSMEGMFVESEAPKPIGTLVQFELEVPGKAEPIQGLGDVVWVRSGKLVTSAKPMGMGIQFRYVDPRSRDQIFQIVGDYLQRSNEKKAGSLDEAAADAGDAAETVEASEAPASTSRAETEQDTITSAGTLGAPGTEDTQEELPAALGALSAQGSGKTPSEHIDTATLEPESADAVRMERPPRDSDAPSADPPSAPGASALENLQTIATGAAPAVGQVPPNRLPPLSTALGLDGPAGETPAAPPEAGMQEDGEGTAAESRPQDVIVDSGSTGSSEASERATEGPARGLAGLSLEDTESTSKQDELAAPPSVDADGAPKAAQSAGEGVLFRLEDEDDDDSLLPDLVGNAGEGSSAALEVDPLATIAAPASGMAAAARAAGDRTLAESGAPDSPATAAPKVAASAPTQAAASESEAALSEPPMVEGVEHDEISADAPTVVQDPVPSGTGGASDSPPLPLSATENDAPSAGQEPLPGGVAKASPAAEPAQPAPVLPTEFSLPRESSTPLAAPAPAAPLAVEMPTEDQVSGQLELAPPVRRLTGLIVLVATLLLVLVAALLWWQRERLFSPEGGDAAVAPATAAAANDRLATSADRANEEEAVPSEPEAVVAVQSEAGTDGTLSAQDVAASAASSPSQATEADGAPRRASRLVEEDDPTAPTIPSDTGARQVQGLQVDELTGSTLVRVVGDRPFVGSQIEVVSLESPPRFVVKIGGVPQLFRTGARGARISRIRSGVHPGPELHLVLDLTSGEFETTADVVDGELLIGVEDL